MSDGISAINSVTAANLYATVTAEHLSMLTSATIDKLDEYNIDIAEVKSEEEAQALIKQKETEKAEKVKAQKNSETYFDKQIISDAINLAEDLGIYVGTGSDIRTLMDNIKSRLTHLNNTVGNNERMKTIVDEYSNRYDYIYAQYMNKKDILSNQIITTLDAMSISSTAMS